MQRIVAALALSTASGFVAPVAKTSAVARASDATETAAPAKTGFTYADLKAHLRRLFHAVDAVVATEEEPPRDQKHAQALAKEQNPIVGYFDPLELGDKDFWEQGNEATIAWFRHAEIKHGRVAMFGFVGYLVHAKGVTWPFAMTLAGDKWPTLGEGGVPALWDALPEISKWQIILFVGALEFWSEIQGVGEGAEPHYMRGGKPGQMRSFKALKLGIPDLYDPAGGMRNASPEKKARGRLIEINNGRLAMIGLFGFLAEAKVPGSVPFLGKVGIPAYAGDIMAPFESNFHILS